VSWKNHKIGDLVAARVLKVSDGYRVTNLELGPEGIPFVRGGDIGDGSIDTDTIDRIRPEYSERVRNKLTEPGDVAFITKGTVGRVGFLRADQPPVVFAPQVCYWRVVDKDKIDPRFIFYLLRGAEFQANLDAVKTHGSMVADYVSITDQLNFRLTFPPFAEQHAIAQILGALDDKIELNRRMNETLESLTATVFSKWLADNQASLRSIGTQDLIDQKTLLINDGYRAKNSELDAEGLPFARAGNLNNGFDFSGADLLGVNSIPAAGNKVSQPYDSVFTSKGTVGRIALVMPGTPQFVYSPQLCFWRSQDTQKLHSLVLHQWMRSREFQRQVDVVKGQTDMADYVNLRDQRRMKITLPWDIDSERIGGQLESLTKKVDLNLRESQTLAALRDTLLPKLLSGEVRVRDAEKVVGEAV